jgi:DNA-binding NtrC family response regulator
LNARTRLPTLRPPPLSGAEAFLQRKATVLVVDDEELYRRALERMLQRVGHVVVAARDASEALALVAAQPIDLVLADVRMPGINGLELVRQIHEFAPDLPCIVITGYGGAEQSVEALRAGAFWYLEKPFDQGHLDVVRRLVDQAIEMGRLRVENRLLQRELRSKYGFESIVGSSQALRSVLDVVAKVADSDSTVLITGESGTGKELIARAIHYNSRRAERMFVTVNCGAIPEELLESELFGHVRGAFTNAVSHREGRFALANDGTIFLDEIGDMSTNLQVKLLRVLQDRTFEPVGSSKTVSVNVRVIAATNQDLEQAIRERRFREDLFYRLNVIPIEAPPLRQRREDIPLLVRHFLERSSRARGRAPAGIANEALELLCTHDWPGNVRELENLIERLVTLGDEREIAAADLPANLRRASAPVLGALRVPATGLSFRDVVEEVEEQLIREALEHTHGNKNRAAQLLGLNRTTLLEKIKRRALVRPPQLSAPDGPLADGFATDELSGRRSSDAFAAGRPQPPPLAAAAPRKRLRNGRPHPPRQIPDESGT